MTKRACSRGGNLAFGRDGYRFGLRNLCKKNPDFFLSLSSVIRDTPQATTPGMALMSKSRATTAYAQSLLWVALFMAVTVGVMNIVELMLIDFIHGNPHRTQSNAIFMMAIYTPILGVIAVIGSFLVFTLPQFFQATLISVLGQLYGSRASFAALLALPLTVVLTWYCYDYLTPTDFNLGINEGPDWSPFQHGLSASRYWKTFTVQAPITLFSFFYFNAALRGGSKKALLVVALTIAVVVGLMWGYILAQNQFQFL